MCDFYYYYFCPFGDMDELTGNKKGPICLKQVFQNRIFFEFMDTLKCPEVN